MRGERSKGAVLVGGGLVAVVVAAVALLAALPASSTTVRLARVTVELLCRSAIRPLDGRASPA